MCFGEATTPNEYYCPSKMNALLSTTYFGPIQWYQKLYRADEVWIEQHESFQKQTYRNRCVIATTQGTQVLTVPVRSEERRVKSEEFPSGVPVDSTEGMAAANSSKATGRRDNGNLFTLHSSLINNVRISDHGNWRHLHWNALKSAYGDSPFFMYYEDDLRPFFERRWDYLFDFNEAIREKICELLDIHPNVHYTNAYLPSHVGEGTGAGLVMSDFRNTINPKHPAPDPDFEPRRYYQVYEAKHGFQPNLSIVDLLFNMGPESIFYL